MKIVSVLAQADCDNNNQYCPAVMLTDTGDVAVIGKTAASEVRDSLPDGTGVGTDESLVVVPRDVLVQAGWSPPVA